MQACTHAHRKYVYHLKQFRATQYCGVNVCMHLLACVYISLSEGHVAHNCKLPLQTYGMMLQHADLKLTIESLANLICSYCYCQNGTCRYE